MNDFSFLKSGPVLIRPNKNTIIQSVLLQPEAEAWTKEDYNYTYSYEPNVPRASDEYRDIKNLFYGTSSNMSLRKIKRIQNPFLLGEFLLKREEMERYGPVEVRKLFHGTKKESLEGIIKDGFDWRLHGENRGVRFGNGVNFTPQAGFADNFGDRTRSRIMILAYVLVGETCIGRDAMVLPDTGCDTAIKSDGKVIVKFEDGEHYPAYILYYRSFKK